MHDKSSNPLGLAPSAWITVLIAVMGIFALNQYPFQDMRPLDLWVPAYSHTATEDQDVEARLWQDPLAAVETARRVSVTNNGDQPKNAVPLPKPCAEWLSSTPRTENPDVHSVQHLCSSINSLTSDGVLVMGAMVSGAPYAADIENRRRTRYAVLAGLYRSGYMPLNNQHVGYVRLAELYADPIRANDLAAFEWFVSDTAANKTRAARVLLLWLDQDGFRTTPIEQLSTITTGLLPKNVPTVILGPADSDGLRAMAEEINKSKPPDRSQATDNSKTPDPYARPISIYSSMATAEDDAITDGSQPLQGKHFQFSGLDLHLYRSVVTDDAVAKAVRDELTDRKIVPAEIALVAERDTLYARSMGKYFTGCANPPRENPGNIDGDVASAPLCITYLKGLDGIGPPPPKQAGAPNATSAGTVKATDHPGNADTAQDASTGPRQLDYLRRMGAALNAMQGASDGTCQSISPNDCKPHYIKAIGVLGTDIYDKLLVLQELRPMFPDVVFFTFGLDARYTDAANLPWTRRLLVGSALGLSLKADLQGDIPAFRDSYQAATFYSTLLALHRASLSLQDSDKLHEDAGLQWTKKPMVFEIGRKKPLDLLMNLDADTHCDFDGTCPSISASRTRNFAQVVTQSTASALVVAVPVVLWMVLRAGFGKVAMRRRLPVLRLSCNTLIVLLGIFSVLWMRFTLLWSVVENYLTGHSRYMPVPIADGASLWGKELLEASIIPLVITLLIRGQRKLNDNANRIRREFRFASHPRSLVRRYASAVSTWPWRRREKEWTYVPIGYLSNDEDKAPVLPHLSALESLVARYLYRGVWQKRWLRVLVATMLLIVTLKFLEWLGFSQFAGVPWLATQARKHGVTGWIAFCCVICVQLLIFWVIDAILLTRAFLLAVARYQPPWPPASLSKARQELGLPDDLSTVWLSLRLISRRTHWVSNFVWYPSLVIAGMFVATFTVEYGQYRFESNPVILLVSIGLIVAAVVLLRRAAENWRADLLRRLSDKRLALLATPQSMQAVSPNQGALAQVEALIEMVKQLRDGAFAPYSEQPLVRAVLLPAVTFAATAGLPYLHVG
jgi:hypothetical protein